MGSSSDAWMRSELCSLAADLGRKARAAVMAVPPSQRAERVRSKLKPPPETSAYADVVGEDALLDMLADFSNTHAVCFHVIQDAASSQYVSIGTSDGRVIWCYLDAVDGTVKVAGLGNDGSALRIINDGAWGVGVAFTDLTSKALEALEISDFTVTAIIDGNPPVHPTFPTVVVAVRTQTGWQTMDYNHTPPVLLHTSSLGNLSQAAVYYDAFQAFDHNTSTLQLEQLAGALYGKLINRHAGGAFDVWRMYGNLSSLIRCMLGYRQDGEQWHEPQCAGFVVLNENLPNLIPSVPIILGAGGVALTFDGTPLIHRKLVDGRASVVYSSNEETMQCLKDLIAQCK